MSITAFSSAFANGVFATGELCYSLDGTCGLAIVTVIGSQLLGYSIVGLIFSVACTRGIIILMLGPAVAPDNLQANMCFQLLGSNAATQGVSLAQDLELAQCTKLPPRTTLWVQSLGTVVTGILQIVIAKQILKTHRTIRLNVAGNNIWSGHDGRLRGT